MSPTGAKGHYLEHHDLPHYHQPRDAGAGGYLVLGRPIGAAREGQVALELTAFAIPFGSAVLTPPGVVHNDSWLVGNYRVMYGLTEVYSTVRLSCAVSIRDPHDDTQTQIKP